MSEDHLAGERGRAVLSAGRRDEPAGEDILLFRIASVSMSGETRISAACAGYGGIGSYTLLF